MKSVEDSLSQIQKQHLFTDWVSEYSGSMLSWAIHKVKTIEDAEDLVQEAFRIGYERYEKFENRSSIKTWLMGILNILIKEYYRKNSRNPHIDTIDVNDFFDSKGNWLDAHNGIFQDESNLADDPDFIKALNKCRSSLKPFWKQVFHLRYEEDKNADEICGELHINKTNYWQIIHRSKLELRRCMKRIWFNVS